MKALVTFIIALLFPLAGIAQTGTLVVHIESPGMMPSTIVLLKNDSIIRTAHTNTSGSTQIDFIPAGTYQVRVSQPEHITTEMYEVIIEDYATTTLDVSLNHQKKSVRRAGEEPPHEGPYTGPVISASIHPALDGSVPSDAFVSSYRYGVGNTFFSSNPGFMHIAWTQVLSAGGHRLDNAARVKPKGIEAPEKYFYINYTFSLSARADIVKGDDPGQPKLYLETGAGYALPFYYRHISKEGRTVIHSRNIHKFTETHAFARIGFGWMSVRYRYNLSDHIKPGFPEPPRSEIALEMIFGD